jgi:phosphate transport system substrate-binding protein
MKYFGYLAIAATFFGDVLTSCDKADNNSDKSTFVVSFNSNGGSAVLQQVVKKGEKVTKPTDPTLGGHILMSWYGEVPRVRGAELTYEWSFNFDMVTTDMTLHAKWYAIDSLFKINGLTINNYPSVDGSTSTAPLNISVACKLLDIPFQWVGAEFGASWDIKPYLKDNNATKFQEQVKSSQTHQSFINLIDGKADLILSARATSSDEKEYADAAGIHLIETPIALDAFIFVVHPNNPVRSLTIAQVQDIYTGKIINWKEVGGIDAKINPYIREPNSGSQELMKLLVMKDLNIMDFPYSPDIIWSMAGVFDKVITDVNAICYSVFYYREMILRGASTKTISVEGIYPNKSTIANNSYPLVAEVYAIIRSDTDKSSMTYKLYELLQTQEGKRVIAESGYVAN